MTLSAAHATLRLVHGLIRQIRNYAFPQPFGRVDWIMAGLVIAVMTVWLIAGVWM